MRANVNEMVAHDRCCGCMACMVSCPIGIIQEEKDSYGFWYPKIDADKCVTCGKCLEVCPVINESAINVPQEAYAALNKDSLVVYNSSSGGVFTALAEEIIKCGGVVCGAEMDADNNVSHVIVYTLEDLSNLRKSKYVQSKLKDTFSQIKMILEKQMVLFSGTPCQVAALKSFLGKDYENLLTIDVVCHGTPSNDLFTDYLSFLERNIGKIEKYEFRAKKKSNNGMNWFSAITLSNKKRKVFNWPTDSYNFYYMKCKTYRESCYNCQFAKKNRSSDITLCDYWGWENYHSGQFCKQASVSGVIINSEKGKQLYNSIEDRIVSDVTQYEHIAEHNRCLTEGSKRPCDREKILDIWRVSGYEALNKHFVREHRMQIIKYKFIGAIPDVILRMIKR